ncbi:rod shape-determining protein MreC [Mycobacterium sp. 1274761.0]|uniref:rod shape-determining protein MreC n=1 Tax=Mycobacterium sp. 1274761.0 TaxID=1834077 RepID=UPI0007FBCBF8|nr:rod shape-determining protein MreC [Mycobacterium sp. 1274761.0]OBK75016.1 hypothetical protein A5651_09110 [Mycobacterium sp. 1274761.0]
MSKPIEGSVARVEDQYTLIINRGSDHGVEEAMEFAVLNDQGDQIIDPETGDVIGEEPSEKLRVRVYEVHPKYSRAATFRQYQPSPVKFPTLSAAALGAQYGPDTKLPNFLRVNEDLYADLAKKLVDTGAIDTFSNIVRAEMENPRPRRQQIASAKRERPKEAPVQPEVTVNIGDKVRQVAPEPSRAR